MFISVVGRHEINVCLFLWLSQSTDLGRMKNLRGDLRREGQRCVWEYANAVRAEFIHQSEHSDVVSNLLYLVLLSKNKKAKSGEFTSL